MNILCAVSKSKMYGPFFFVETTVNGIVYLYNVLQKIFLPLAWRRFEDSCIPTVRGSTLLAQGSSKVLERETPNSWIGRCGEDDLALLKWPPRSPDLTVCDFFLWSYVKDKAYIPPIAQTLQELRERICVTVTTINQPMLARVSLSCDITSTPVLWSMVYILCCGHTEHL